MYFLGQARWVPLLSGSLLLGALACTSNNNPKVHDVPSSQPITLQPANQILAIGHTLQFTVTGAQNREILWSVAPATAGSIDAAGLFTPGQTPGPATITAILSGPSSQTASVQLQILPPALVAFTSPDVALVSGARQGSLDNFTQNDPVAGENLPFKSSADATGQIQVRHGFYPLTQQ